MRRREGGREGKVIPRVWENTVATEGMLGNLNSLGDGRERETFITELGESRKRQ